MFVTHVYLQLKMIEWKNSKTKQLTNELLTLLITVTRCLTNAAQEGRGFSGFQLKDTVSPSWKGSHSGRSWRYQVILPLQSGRRERGRLMSSSLFSFKSETSANGMVLLIFRSSISSSVELS